MPPLGSHIPSKLFALILFWRFVLHLRCTAPASEFPSWCYQKSANLVEISNEKFGAKQDDFVWEYILVFQLSCKEKPPVMESGLLLEWLLSFSSSRGTWKMIFGVSQTAILPLSSPKSWVPAASTCWLNVGCAEAMKYCKSVSHHSSGDSSL